MNPTPTRSALILLALAGCSTPEPLADDLGAATSSLSLDRVAPPLVLEDGPFILRRSQLVTVTGANPGDRVAIAGSDAPGGGTPTCLSTPAVCLDLAGPTSAIRFLGEAVADANGEARVRVPSPFAPSPGGAPQIQAVGDPFGTPYLSNVVDVRWVDRDGDFDNDGLSNNDELANGTDMEVDDSDGGGELDGAEVAAGRDPNDPTDDFGVPTDDDNDGFDSTVDCDDNDPTSFPGATEVCDGADNDCNGAPDDGDTWLSADYAYRIPVTVQGSSSWDTMSPAVSVDVDFGAALTALGDPSGFDPTSVRVAREDCLGLGQPELPSQFLDGLTELFEPVDSADALGDEVGSVVFLADDDGDYGTQEALSAGATKAYAIYFNSNATTTATSPNYSSTLSVPRPFFSGTMGNALSDSAFSAFEGGITTRVGAAGQPSTGAMNTSYAHGIYMGSATTGGWVTPRDASGATLTRLAGGPVLGMIQANGSISSAFGGYDYTYTYFQFEGRPELYAKVTYTFNQPSTVYANNFWGNGVRPWLVNNTPLSQAGPSAGGGDIPGYQFAWGEYDSTGSAYGAWIGWRADVRFRSRPLFVASGTNAGQFISLAGQDLQGTFAGGDTYSGSAGQRVIDHAILAVYPFVGTKASLSTDFEGALEGTAPSIGAAQAQ